MKYSKLLESLESRNLKETSFRRYNLSEIISESYKALYDSPKGSNLQKLAEAHLDDVRRNPAEIDRLSRQLCKIKSVVSMVESKEIKDEELLVPEDKYDTVEPKKKVEESAKDSEYYTPTKEEADAVVAHIKKNYGKKISDNDYIDVVSKIIGKDEVATDIIDTAVEKAGISINMTESAHDEEVEEKEDNDLLEDTDLTDEELAELTKHLTEIRKNKKVNEASEDTRIYQYGIDIEQGASINPVDTEEALKQLLADAGYEVVGCMAGDNSWSKAEYGIFDSKKVGDEDEKATMKESKSYDNLNLVEFTKKSAGKAFVRTFKKLDGKLHEGTALTRQESISLYKAANSAMTHLSVELEHNPEFLPVFNESVTLLSVDVSKLLESMKNGKAPSKSTMKSLAKFSEALLREDEEEELPPIEDEEENIVSEEDTEQFDQEYAEARVELHKELAEEHADDENPEIEERLEQDAEEIANLPGVTDEQIAEIQGEEAPVEPEEEEASEEEITDEGTQHDEDVEDLDEKELSLDDDDITDDELAELKKHLTEMRSAKKIKESKGRRLMRRDK